MTIKISHWYGRLGNNIQQLSNAIYYCKKNKINFSFNHHPYIKNFQLNFGINSDFSSRFFYYEKNRDFINNEKELNENRRQICLEHISKNLIVRRPPFDINTLVIHIRGGDIFSTNPPSTYIQNPLSFYVNIINNFNKIIVVSEDFKNPVLEKLSNLRNVEIQSTTVENDFATLVAAKNLVTSGVGTFSIAAALCSNNIENLFCSNLFLKEHLNPTMLLNKDINVNITNIDYNKYILKNNWRNTCEQRKLMINYKI